MACKNHPDRESVAICVVCQTEVCDECRTVADGKSYCAADAPPTAATAPPPPPPPPTGPAGTPSMPPPPLSGAAAAGAPGGGTDDPSQENPVVALLCYLLLWIGGVIVLATDMKKSRYMRFHAFHGLFYLVAWIAFSIAASIISALPVIQILALIIWPLGGLALLILGIVLAVKAYNKQEMTLPLITQWARAQADKMRV